MDSVLILTISGRDRVGLVEQLAGIVASHGGNWEHCRLAHLAGRFAGLLQVRVTADRQLPLEAALRGIDGLDVMIANGEADSPPPAPGQGGELAMELLGSDHPGIVREVFHALAEAAVNVEELITATETAPDSGAALFRAQARLACTADMDLESLREALQAIAADVMVDLNLHQR